MSIYDDTPGNTLESLDNIAYIVGDSYAMLENLSCIFSISKFMRAVITQHLPTQCSWVIGQGLSRDEIRFLRLCEQHLDNIKFFFGSQGVATLIDNKSLAQSVCVEYEIVDDKAKQDKIFEWYNFHFLDATRVQAELVVMQLSESLFFAQDFLFTAARELSERACQTALSDSVMMIKQANLQIFHRLFPLPIMVETQFTLSRDNKRSLKSLTRFYQDYACAAEVTIFFDLYTQDQAREFYQILAEKTVGHLSKKIRDEC